MHSLDPRWSHVIQKHKQAERGISPRREKRNKGLIRLLKPTDVLERKREKSSATKCFSIVTKTKHFLQGSDGYTAETEGSVCRGILSLTAKKHYHAKMWLSNIMTVSTAFPSNYYKQVSYRLKHMPNKSLNTHYINTRLFFKKRSFHC